jgi:peptide/nickel transport system substrate-binding protein
MTSRNSDVVSTDGLNRRELLVRAGGLGLSGTALGSLLDACGGSSSSPAASSGQGGPPRRGGTLTYAWNFVPGSILDPLSPANNNNGNIWTTVQLYDRLVELLPGSLAAQPGLAEAWDISSDGTKYTFHLRDGVTFTNGQAVTAEDVRFSIARWGNPKINVLYGFLASGFKDVRVVGPKAVQVTLDHPVGALLDYLTHFTASIVPKNVVEKLGTRFNEAPVGSGPFMLKSRTPGQALTLVRNPNYWRAGKPYLDEVNFEYVPDDNARILKVLSGGFDVAAAVPYSQLARIRTAPGVKLLLEPAGAVGYVDVNNAKAPMSETAVRLALSYATPRDALRSAIYRDAVELANSQAPKLQYWDSSVPVPNYDINRATALMRQSSVPNGFSATYTYEGSDSDSALVATILQSSWAKIGVKLTLEQVDVATFYKRREAYQFDFIAGPVDEYSTDVAAPDELIAIPIQNFPGYNYRPSPTTRRLFNEAAQTNDSATRKAKFAELQSYMETVDPFWVTTVFPSWRTVVADKVQGFHTLVTGFWRLEDVWLAS